MQKRGVVEGVGIEGVLKQQQALPWSGEFQQSFFSAGWRSKRCGERRSRRGGGVRVAGIRASGDTSS